MDKTLLRGLLADASVTQGAVFDDLLPVALGIRRAAQIIIPGELLDAAEIGRAIDGRFRLKLAGQRLPGESLLVFVRDRLRMRRPRDRASELRQRVDMLRDVASLVIGRSPVCRSLMDWIERLGLETKEAESRPTIRELYVFSDPAVAAELDELQAVRRAVPTAADSEEPFAFFAKDFFPCQPDCAAAAAIGRAITSG